MRSIALLLLGVPILCAQSVGSEEKACIDALRALAKEAITARLVEEAQAIQELILRLDPDDALARKSLGFTRDPSGGWKPPQRPLAPKTAKSAREIHGPAHLDKLRAITGTYVDARLQRLLAEGRSAKTGGRAALEELLRLAPDHEGLRKELGEVRGDKGWIDAGAERAIARRKELVAWLQDQRQGLIATSELDLRPDLKSLGVDPGARRRAGSVVVLAADPKEAETLALHAELAARLARHVIGGSKPLPERYAVLVVEGMTRDRFLKHPAIDPTYLAHVEQYQSMWAGHDLFATWAPTPAERLDIVVRQTIGIVFRDHFQLSLRQGFAWEGFGLYLGHMVTGTRLSWFARPGRYDGPIVDWRAKLRDPNADWLLLGYEVVKTRAPNSFQAMVGKDANALDEQDLLASHALAAWILSAHADDVGPLLSALGAGDAPQAVLEKTLGHPTESLGLPLRRWLKDLLQQSGTPVQNP